MARAKRHSIPGHIWHITHRYHKREFLLKFTKDRRWWLQWFYEARRRYGLTILDYIVTSDHRAARLFFAVAYITCLQHGLFTRWPLAFGLSGTGAWMSISLEIIRDISEIETIAAGDSIREIACLRRGYGSKVFKMSGRLLAISS